MVATSNGYPLQAPEGSARRFLPVVLGLLVVGGLYWQSFGSMVQIWTESATYGHGFLIVPACLVLVWWRRDRLAAVPLRFGWLGLPALVGACLTWYVGHLTDTNLLVHVSLVALVHAVVLCTMGWAAYRILIFPLIYLFLAVPFGDFSVTWLQGITADWTVVLLKLTGVAVHQESWLIQIPGGTFYVAEVCAGVRYVLASIALSLLICEMFLYRVWHYVLFVVLGIAVPVVANAIRAYGIIMLAYLSGFELAVGVDHLIYGWFFFVLIAACLVWLGLFVSRRVAPTAKSRERRTLGKASPAATVRGLVLVVAASLATVGAAAWRTASLAEAETIGTLAPLPAPAGWHAAAAPEAWHGSFAGADAAQGWGYRGGDGAEVALQLALWGREVAGREAISINNTLSSGWTIVRRGVTSVAAGAGTIPVAFEHVRFGGDDRLVWWWYWIDGELIAEPWRAKLQQAKVRLVGGDRTAGLIGLSTSVVPGRDPKATLGEFLDAVDLSGWLGDGRRPGGD